ncbi:extracellular solute-binding protein [Eubacteriales bacterium mix99]
MKWLKRILSVTLAMVLTVGILAGCSGEKKGADNGKNGQEVASDDASGNKGKDKEGSKKKSVPDYLNKSGFPIAKEPITLTAMVSQHVSQPAWKEMLCWQEYEKMTGIKMEWQEVSSELTEKRNLVLTSGKYPDLFYRASVPDTELLKYGSQGVFISLNDLIEQYAPNYKKMMEDNPAAEKAAYAVDGNAYSFVQYTDSDPVQINPKLFLNKEWLAKVGKEMPTTTEELYDVLKAFKEGDPNGNGKADEIPWSANSLDLILNSLYGAFGLRNRGTDHGYVDMNEETGELRFIPVQPEYKEMLQYLNKLYKEGLIDQEIFTMDVPQLVAKGDQNQVGAFSFTNTEQIGHTGEKSFEGLHEALEGPHGDKLWAKRGSVGARGAFVITDKCKYPEAAVRWIDYFYSEEGGKLPFLGVEGKSYEKKPDGSYEFLDEIVNDIPEGSSFDQVISKYVTYTGGGIPALQRTEYFKGGETHPVALKAAEDMAPYTPKEMWNKFNYTLEEIDRKAALESDINGYISQMYPQFIQGKVSFKKWDSYVDQIKKMGLDEYMDIYTKGYKRYSR